MFYAPWVYSVDRYYYGWYDSPPPDRRYEEVKGCPS